MLLLLLLLLLLCDQLLMPSQPNRRYVLHVPYLLQEAGQLTVLQLEREAHLRVLVAERPQLGQDRQQLRERDATLRVAPVPVQDVDAQRVDVVALDRFHQLGLLEPGPVGEDDDRGQQRVLDVVHRERVHLPAEVQQVLDRVRHARHLVRVTRVRSVVGKEDGVGFGVVPAGHSQHHHLTGAGLFNGRVEWNDMIRSS